MRRIVVALGLSAVASLAIAFDVDPLVLKWSTTPTLTPKILHVTAPRPFRFVGAPTWARFDPPTGQGPQDVAVVVDHGLVPKSTVHRLSVVLGVGDINDLWLPLDLDVSCSASSGCGEGPHTAPTGPATASATRSPSPIRTATATRTALPTAGITSAPPPPSAVPTALPPPVMNCRANPTTPVRYSCAEVGLALERLNEKSNMFKWDARTGCTATEYQRRNMDSQRLVCLRKLQVYLDSLGPDGRYVADKVDNKVFYQLLEELAPYIFDLALSEGMQFGHWSIDLNGFYGHSGLGLGDVRYQVRSNKRIKAAMVAKPMPTELRQALDLAPDFSIGDPAITLPPKRPFDAVHSRIGMIQTRLPRVKPSAACKAAVSAAHSCHAQGTAFQCGRGAKPTCNTQDLHRIAEEVCGRDCGEECQNVPLMRNFYATPDYDDPTTPEKDGWTQDEVCTWFEIADAHHGMWHADFLDDANQTSWAFIELDDEDHNRDHMALTRYSAITKFMWSCEKLDQNGVLRHVIHGCPLYTAPEYLAHWRATHPQRATAVQALSAEQPRIAAKLIDGTLTTEDVLDPAPAPTPTHVRVDNRPSATPVPGMQRIAIDPVGPITLPAKVTITARRLNLGDKINALRVWFKTPFQSPEPKTKAYCAKTARLSKTKVADTITCNLNDRAPRGPWLLCPYVFDEPGRAFGGLYEGCQTVEVR